MNLLYLISRNICQSIGYCILDKRSLEYEAMYYYRLNLKEVILKIYII